MKIRLTYAVAACAVLVLGGCAFFGGGSTGSVSSAEQAAFQKVFMSSYYAERGGVPGGARGLTPFIKVTNTNPGFGSKATVPVNQFSDNHFATLTPKTFVNYPEPGQTTTFTITTQDAGNNVYDITATTTYPSGDLRKTYVEEYYVIDGNPTFLIGPDTIWDTNDAIVRQSGGLWVQDQKARVQQVLTFADGTTRTETIVAMSPNSTTAPLFKTAGFNVTGSLDFGQLFYPEQETVDPKVQFSSVVMYYVTPAVNTNFWFWQGTQAKTILGIRYYTEYWDTGSNMLTTYTVAFERTVNSLTTTGGSFSTSLASVFVGSNFNTLAESVLRQQVTYTLVSGVPDLGTGSKITNMKTRVADIATQKDFYLQQLDTDFVTLSNYDTTTIYTPTGAVNELVAADPSLFVYSRLLASSGNSLPLFYDPLTTTDTTGTGDLATLYTSIQEGNAALSTGTTIPGSIQPPGIEWLFNGGQGTTIPASSVTTVGLTGTVEAWVYINQHVDTGGIVHKGIKTDFSDECYSLQFWGNQGQVAFVVDGAGGGVNYDIVQSTTKLNTAKWYYLVGTWDNQSPTKTVKLYINGNLNKTVTATHGGAQSPLPDPAVIVGSQLPTQYNGAYGYFGFNGKINGVRISNTTMSAATVAANYATYILQTPNW